MNPVNDKTIKNPLQLLGFYLGWMETAGAAALFSMTSVNHWTRYFLIFVMGFGIMLYVLVAAYVLIVLVNKTPHFLFNPSDYDKDVQPLLFGGAQAQIKVSTPPTSQS